MGAANILDRAQDSENDFRGISQLTQVGALADDVVGDLIRVDAGLISGSESAAIRGAADLFASVAESGNPATGFWGPERLSDTLRLVAGVESLQQGDLPSEDVLGWAAAVAADLRTILGDHADHAVVERLEQQFGAIATATLAASADALRQRGYATSWLRS
ncbi:MAG TPA: hypothetical protein VNR37_07330 [Microbacteriaceae bacterium]|jgi:hypothetical protein|nr:hypothetical protein [Microbacteriaceae bacterium]